jgi:hypothetical protein
MLGETIHISIVNNRYILLTPVSEETVSILLSTISLDEAVSILLLTPLPDKVTNHQCLIINLFVVNWGLLPIPE